MSSMSSNADSDDCGAFIDDQQGEVRVVQQAEHNNGAVPVLPEDAAAGRFSYERASLH